MIRLDYPEPAFRTRQQLGKTEIFDRFRRAWVKLTPEEWVRQNILSWFTETLQYPAELIAVEKELQVGAMRKRYDILLFDPAHQPWMLVECKAPEVTLGEKTLLQILRYNMKMQAAYLLVTNGHYAYAADIRAVPAAWLTRMPVFPSSQQA